MEAIEFETTPKGGTIQIPEPYKAQFSARIRVVLLREAQEESLEDKEARHQRGHRMVEALIGIAGRGGISGIGDPSQWQRSQRTERSLPGRGKQ